MFRKKKKSVHPNGPRHTKNLRKCVKILIFREIAVYGREWAQKNLKMRKIDQKRLWTSFLTHTSGLGSISGSIKMFEKKGAGWRPPSLDIYIYLRIFVDFPYVAGHLGEQKFFFSRKIAETLLKPP